MAPVSGAVRVLDTAAGRFRVEATARGIARMDGLGEGVVSVGFDDDGDVGTSAADRGDSDAAAEHLTRLAEQLDGYLAGTLRRLDVPLDLEAAGVHDEFSREVYREIQHIPYGETSTYGQVSIDAGRPRNARRVGRLCSLVPAPLLIPVHRVIRADGGLGNCPEYRLRLIEHERRNVQAGRPVAFPRG